MDEPTSTNRLDATETPMESTKEWLEWYARKIDGCDPALFDDTPLTPEHMEEAGWGYDQMSFTHSKKLKYGVLLVRSASQTYLLVNSNAGFQRCDLKHVETVSDFTRLCDMFEI